MLDGSLTNDIFSNPHYLLITWMVLGIDRECLEEAL